MKTAVENYFSESLKEQVEQLESEVSKLQDDLNAAKKQEDALRESEREKQGCLEKNFALRKEINHLQAEINQLNQLLQKTQFEQRASFEKVGLLNAEVLTILRCFRANFYHN